MEFVIQISQRNKNYFIDPVFANWVNLIKKVSIINCSGNSKSFKAIYFLLFNSKVEVVAKNDRFSFLFLCVHLLFSNSVDNVFFTLAKTSVL